MRRLLVDVGNSRLKAWVREASEPLPRRPFSAPHHGEPELLLAGTQLNLPDPLDEVWIAHVLGPEHEARLARRVVERFGLTAQFVRSSGSALGLRSAYAEPSRLGVDRWLAMLAAWAERGVSTLVVDAGTALTVDALIADGEGGRHLGGLIAPGLQVAQAAVLGATRFGSVLKAQELALEIDAGPGTQTLDCVRQGAILGVLGAVDRARRWIPRGAERLILTGGDSALLLPHLEGDWEHRPYLVLEGIGALADSRTPRAGIGSP